MKPTQKCFLISRLVDQRHLVKRIKIGTLAQEAQQTLSAKAKSTILGHYQSQTGKGERPETS